MYIVYDLFIISILRNKVPPFRSEVSVVILTVILYCPINHWSRHYEPGLCLFNLELHLSSPAPGPTNVTVLLFAFTIFTVFPT